MLAVAGLIMAIVLVAIPQLQRSQRNSARKDILGRIKTEIDSYSGNNNGNVPAGLTAAAQSNFGSPTAASGFMNRYLGCSGSPAVCSISISDPSTGFPVGSGQTGTAVEVTAANATPGVLPGAAHQPGAISYSVGSVCSGEALVNGNGRNYALMMKLEGGAIFCTDNK